jgi:hypothetical protein
MKKRFLPFGFFLGFLSLSVTIFGFSSDDQGKGKENISLRNSQKVNSGEYLNMIRANQNTGLIELSDLQKAKKQAEAIANPHNSRGLNWVTIGPDNYGGRTRAIIYDNQDASGNVVYAGAVTGGLWKSSDNGITWKKINEDGTNLYVSSMCQSDGGTIYVGTGELFSAQEYSMFAELGYTTGFMGSGMYKSNDGENFELIASTKPEVGNSSDDWAFINEVQVDKNGRIYAATNSGLRYSEDGGSSWMAAKDTAGNELLGMALDVKVGDGVVLATVNNKCYYSSGDAQAFKILSTGEDNKLPLSDDISRVEFAIAPSDNSIVYASMIKTNGNLYGIYRSENGGEDWSLILPGTNSLMIFYFSGMYFNTITVFPDNPDKVLLGGGDLWLGFKTNDTGLFYWEVKSSAFTSPFLPSFVAMGHHAYAFRPGHPDQFLIGTNSGVFTGKATGESFEFSEVNNKYYTTQFYTVGNSGIENYVVGGTNENGMIIMDQQSNSTGYGRVILGFLQGYSYYSNAGDAAVSLINPNIIVVGSAQGVIYRSEDRGQNYSVNFRDGITLSEGFYSPFALWESFNNENSRDSVWFYAGGNSYPGGTAITVKSDNSDYPFKYTLPDDVTLNPGDSILIQDPISSRVFVGSTHHVYMTKDLHKFAKTAEWFEIANTSTGFTGTASALGYSADANHLFVGTTEGKLYRISNLALAYNKELADVNEPTCIVAVSELQLNDPETGNPVTQAVTSVTVDPENPQKVLVTLGNYGNKHYVFYTEDALSQNPTFVSKQGNLPHMPVYSSVIEMSDSKTVIIGTDMGAYITNDITAGNVDWAEAFGNMGRVPVLDLKQQIVAQKSITIEQGGETVVFPGATNYGILYAATYGRGIFRCNDFRKPVGIGEIYSENNDNRNLNFSIYPNPVNDVINLSVYSLKSENGKIQIFDLRGREMLSKNVSFITGENKVVMDVSMLPRGAYMLMIKGKAGVGTQKFVKY